jgi:hypothetical protein
MRLNRMATNCPTIPRPFSGPEVLLRVATCPRHSRSTPDPGAIMDKSGRHFVGPISGEGHTWKSKSGFQLPPDVSFEKQRLSDAWAYVFRHRVLGELGASCCRNWIMGAAISPAKWLVQQAFWRFATMKGFGDRRANLVQACLVDRFGFGPGDPSDPMTRSERQSSNPLGWN